MEENKTLVEVTTDKILRYLKEKQLQVGDKLPNEYELSDYLGGTQHGARSCPSACF